MLHCEQIFIQSNSTDFTHSPEYQSREIQSCEFYLDYLLKYL